MRVISGRGGVLGAAALVLIGAALGWSADDARRMELAEFRERLAAGTIVVVDVRSAQAWRSGHIPGALSVPLDTVGARVKELQGRGKPIVAYCA